jgi:hypothetical protein
MRRKHTWLKNALALAALTASLWAQTQTADNKVPTNPASKPGTTTAAPAAPITAADIQSLKDAIAAQQQEIEELRQLLMMRTGTVPAAGPKAPEAMPVTAAAPAVAPAGLDAAAVEGVSAPQQKMTVQESEMQPNAQPEEGPLTIHFRGINVTPGGYAEGAFVRRSRALGADLPTPFNSLTMPGASQSQMSEFFGSARQSKITTFVDGRLKGVDLSSYVSADFLSAGITSNSNQTNSYTLRLRQAWGQAKFDNGLSFLAGQAWSLVTENGNSIGPDDDLGRTNDARPKTIDPNYNAGFVFARQFGWRVTQKFNDKFALAVAMENAQGTLMTHGNGDDFLLGSAGANGGAYNGGITSCTASYFPPNTTDLITTCTPAAPYTFNPSPDIIVKAAVDPGFGHYEVFALYDRFRDRVFPCGEISPPTAPATNGPCPYGIAGNGPSALGAYNVSRNGGAFGASARFTFLKGLTFGLKGFGGSGVGRYGPAGLPDLAINGFGSPYLIKNLMGLSTLEWNGKKLSVYAYTGAEYAGRATSYDPVTNAYVGYGSPFANNSGCSTEQPPLTNGGFLPASLSKCTADTRVVIEGTGGFWYKFFTGPQGSFRYGIQYSYVTRNTWSGANGLQPHGIDGMIFSSFRYYLP